MFTPFGKKELKHTYTHKHMHTAIWELESSAFHWTFIDGCAYFLYHLPQPAPFPKAFIIYEGTHSGM